jgi:selenium-binding protein 1
MTHACCGPGYASPEAAMAADRETLLYTIALYTGSGVSQPDYLATVDVDPASPTYSQVIHRLPVPYIGDELHHFGWNSCSSCHGDASKSRRFLVIPGLRSSRIYIVDTADAQSPQLHKVVEPEEIAAKTNLSAPHTVHCLADGQIAIAMLGDSNAPGGFLLLDEHFDIAGRWEHQAQAMTFNYDFWYQPRHNVMVSSEWAAPNTFYPGFDLKDVVAGNYGRQLHFWDWQQRDIVQSVDLGEDGLIPLEVRFCHNPDSTHGHVGAALSSNVWHWHKLGESWQVEKVIDVPAIELEGWPFPVPSLITDILLSLDDRYLYFSNWLHGDIRQYDISDRARPQLTGQVWCGGLLGKGSSVNGRPLSGGP